MSIITPYLNFLKSVVFADAKTLQVNSFPIKRQNAIREVLSWAWSNMFDVHSYTVTRPVNIAPLLAYYCHK